MQGEGRPSSDRGVLTTSLATIAVGGVVLMGPLIWDRMPNLWAYGEFGIGTTLVAAGVLHMRGILANVLVTLGNDSLRRWQEQVIRDPFRGDGPAGALVLGSSTAVGTTLVIVVARSILAPDVSLAIRSWRLTRVHELSAPRFAAVMILVLAIIGFGAFFTSFQALSYALYAFRRRRRK